MKTKKVIAISLASALLASAIAVPASAFTPSSSNFEPLFDFDKVPTAQYTLGYEPGTRKDTIGDSKNLKCITADKIGYTYHLEIENTISQSGKALKLNVTENASAGGEFCPLGFYPNRGENKNPTLPDGYAADAFMYWVDFTGFVDKNQTNAGLVPAKGFLFYFQEKDYDEAGNEQKTEIAWRPKSFNNGGYVQLEDGNGGWKRLDMNTANKNSNDFYIPNTYKGWVRIPFDVLELVSGGDWNQHDMDGKIDAKCVTQISMGSGNYASQIGSTLYFDSFGFELKNLSEPTSTSKSDITTTAIAAGTDTTKAPTTAAGSKLSTTKAAGNTTSPKTGEAPITAALLTAVTFAGVLLISKKKRK